MNGEKVDETEGIVNGPTDARRKTKPSSSASGAGPMKLGSWYRPCAGLRSDFFRRNKARPGERVESCEPALRRPKPVESMDRQNRPRQFAVHICIILAGAAALSWEVIWQLMASLAIGHSAMGTAITLCVVMGGMTGGALGMGRFLRSRPTERPLRLYGCLELVVGLSGALMTRGFDVLASIDTWVWSVWPGGATWVHVLGIVALLGIPTLAMGATIPLMGLIARQSRTSIAVLYAGNTFGAFIGTLTMAFFVLPKLGIQSSATLLSILDVGVFGVCWMLSVKLVDSPVAASTVIETPRRIRPPGGWTLSVVFATGFVTFAFEVAWFRAFRAALLSTTDSFAIMLAAVLVSLAIAARIAPSIRANDRRIATVIVIAAALILCMTPVVERFSDFVMNTGRYYTVMLPIRFLQVLSIVGPAVILMGLALPSILEQQHTARNWAIVYAANTLGAVVGALSAAWLFLPTLGFVKTAWLTALLLAALGLYRLRGRTRIASLSLVLVALLVAMNFETGIGKERTIAPGPIGEHRLLEFREGPDSTVAAVEYENGNRALLIDGFQAASEYGGKVYMTWMGTLPMVLHPNPRQGLVICFGTGQTADAVRKEGIEHLDIVDLNAAVFALAHHFPSNEGVLEDERVGKIVMDGRAWMRRSRRTYDVITLEPMPPAFAGTNALYSREFYQAARARLKPGGIMAQWVPFHLLPPPDAMAVSQTFREVFPDSILWKEPNGSNGILLGRVRAENQGPLGSEWPGFARQAPGRILSPEEIKTAVLLDGDALERYASSSEPITDDNQRLAYGGMFSRLQRMYAVGVRVHSESIEAARGPR
jgi:spermidine synthase